MGAADVVPGVSGGTIAFIVGIYEELLGSIKCIDLTALKMLFTGKIGAFWKKINGNFLLSVVLGIGVSIFSLARLMTWLIETYPILLWAFFFGLIIASTALVSRDVKKWNAATVVGALAGAATACVVTTLSPTTTPDTWWFIILSGAIAISAMILPGISGAFILLLIGKYGFIMAAVKELNVEVIALFAVGAVAGIVGFSHFLTWLLKHYRNITVAILTGFMVGSLNKIWPWKRVLETYTDSHGVVQPFKEANVLPGRYAELTGNDPQLWQAVVLCLAGLVLIAAIEAVAGRLAKAKQK